MALYRFLIAVGGEVKKSCQQMLLIMAIIAVIVVLLLVAISVPAAIIYAAIVIGVPWLVFRDPPTNSVTSDINTQS